MLYFLRSILLLLLLLSAGCDMEKYPAPEGAEQPEILIYSGITMIHPLMEISALFEEQERCRVIISYGGSGHIVRAVQVNKVGDLFFPGNRSYLDQLQEQGLVRVPAILGYNVAGFFVQPGNPQGIGSDLSVLLDPDLNIVIGNSEAGAIGKETRNILSKAGIYQQVLDNALYLTTDSKGLEKAIIDNEADIVVNWKAIGHWSENKDAMDFISLGALVEKKPLVMGLLSYSEHPELARKFLTFATSDRARMIFNKYGFQD